MNILFLDDDVRRQREFKSRVPSAFIVETAAGCIKCLELAAIAGSQFDEIHLDHDLDYHYQNSAETNCGMEVCRWMALNKPDVLVPIVHTHNEHAGPEMVRMLHDAGYLAAQWIPFRFERPFI